MTRRDLPNRRPSETRVVQWQGNEIAVTVGYYNDGKPGEIFADVATGGHMQSVVADACILVSIALQHGIPPDALAKSLGRVPGLRHDVAAELPASPVGAIVGALL